MTRLSTITARGRGSSTDLVSIYKASRAALAGFSGGPSPVAAYSQAVAFQAGETVVRLSVSNSSVSSSSLVVGTIQRPLVADADDVGLAYVANVIGQSDAGFDLVVIRFDYGTFDASEWAPSETIYFNYTVGTP